LRRYGSRNLRIGATVLARRGFAEAPAMERDFSVFASPGFWIAVALLMLLFAAGVAVIASASAYPG